MSDKFQEMLSQLQHAQQQAEEVKKELAETEIWEGTDDISVTLTGDSRVKDVSINEQLLNNKEELEDKLLSVLNKGLEKAQAMNEEKMRAAAQGLMPDND